MKSTIIYLLTIITLLSLMSACGPSEEERQQQLQQEQQARQDSLERVRQQRLEQQRQDSIARAQARQDSIRAAQKKREEQVENAFSEGGPFAVQVEAWRSREKAQGQVSKWKERGFENAYVVKHGNEETGDIWFRVRLGRTSTMEMAKEAGQNIREEYNAPFWVANVREEAPADEGSAE